MIALAALGLGLLLLRRQGVRDALEVVALGAWAVATSLALALFGGALLLGRWGRP